ncbi:MAG: glycoside hydrolase family 43 protein [Panacibacter sp.]
MKQRTLSYTLLLLALVTACRSSKSTVNAIAATGNPIITNKYTADPSALVYGDKVYLYTGHDERAAPKEGYEMYEWLCYSSTDMIRWTEHPVPLHVKDFVWAKGDAWASQVIERNGKFYWYAAVEHGSVPGKAIAVAVADNPEGPYRDALGKALITNDMTSPDSKMMWDDIDPTVIIDNGQAYLFWGNRQCYYARLKENMVEIDGPVQTIDLPNYTEAPWIHKHGDWYYLSYAYEFPEKIAYSMSKSVKGPWEYKGILNEVAGNSNTNHQAIIDFKGKSYFIYHNGSINTDGGSFRRSVCIEYLYYNKDGTIKRVQMTTEGVQPSADKK